MINIFRNITLTRVRRHVIEKFAKKIGLIYFGSVDQRHDDHRIVRGFTVSSSHRDSHYSVGSVDGYDVALVDRSDALGQLDGSVVVFNWLIMAFDLQTKQDTPHVFIGAHNHDSASYASFFTTFPVLKEIELGTFEAYSPEFTSRFSIYTQPSDSIEVERLFPAQSARVLSTHFWPYSAELHDGILYIYTDEKRVTQNTLDTMFECGLWLAHHIDSQIELV